MSPSSKWNLLGAWIFRLSDVEEPQIFLLNSHASDFQGISYILDPARRSRARKSVLHPRSFRPRMLEDLGSLTATSECIFSWKRFVKKSLSRQKTFPKSRTIFRFRWLSFRIRESTKGDSSSLPRTSSAIGVDVAAEDDDVGPSARLVSSPEEEGA